MTYRECLTYLESLGHELRGVKFGLETITAILARLGHPHLCYPTAIVAGTNGKGSTSAILASIFQQAGYRTGLYTSPHLVRVNERMRVDGGEISDDDFAHAFTQVARCVEDLRADNSLERLPSFFEFLTATAFVHFAAAKVQFVVLEVGMGGRLDATNVTDARLAAITHIGLDHTEYLGSTHAAIAREKAGVIKPGRPVISACEQPEAREVIRRVAWERQADLLETSTFTKVGNLRSWQGRYTFDLALGQDHFTKLRSPLLGRFQVANAITAVTAAWRLGQEGFRIPRRAIYRGLRRAAWPGRLEAVLAHPLLLLDGAHNPDGAREVAGFLREELAGRTVRLVYASMRDKAMGEITKILFPLAAEIYLTQPDQARAATTEEIGAAAGSTSGERVIEPDPPRAVERAVRASSPEDVVLVTGSLFLVGEVKKALSEGRLRLEEKTAQPVPAPAS